MLNGKDKSPVLGRLAAHGVVKETMDGRSHPQKKAEWSGWGADCPLGRVGRGWLREAGVLV